MRLLLVATFTLVAAFTTRAQVQQSSGPLGAAWQIDTTNDQAHVIGSNHAYDTLVAYTACAVGGCGGGLIYCLITGPA